MIFFFRALAFFALAVGGYATAANVSALDPQSIVRALQEAGYKATQTKVDGGLVVVDTATQGIAIRILVIDYQPGFKAVEFVSYRNCAENMKECIRNAQKLNDEESPVKAIPVPAMSSVATCYYVLYDSTGATASLFIANLELFAFYTQQYNKMFN